MVETKGASRLPRRVVAVGEPTAAQPSRSRITGACLEHRSVECRVVSMASNSSSGKRLEGDFEHRRSDPLLIPTANSTAIRPSIVPSTSPVPSPGADRVDAGAVTDGRSPNADSMRSTARSWYLPIAGDCIEEDHAGLVSDIGGPWGRSVESEEEKMRRLTLVVVTAALAVSCGSGSDTSSPEDQTDPVTSGSMAGSGAEEPETFDLGCETIFEIHADFDAAFEGYATPEDAVESWTPGAGGVPDGEWKQFEGDRWVVLSDTGETVARTQVEVWVSNANTTFANERFVASGIEYCE